MTPEKSPPRRKKILFIPRWYPDRNDSMLGLFIQKHAQAVQLRSDVTVLYVTADPGLAAGETTTEEISFRGIREIRVYFGRHSNRVANVLAYVKNSFRGMNMVLADGVPDVTHVHVLSRSALPALWLKMTKGIPYLITEHWSRYLPVNVSKGAYKGTFRKWFTRYAVKNAFAVTTVTRNLADAMQQLGLKNKYHVIPNVADINEFHPVNGRVNGQVKKLVHVSCFDEPAKNIQGIIRVLKNIATERKDFRMEIIGDGHDFEMVKEFARNSGELGSTLFFTGLLTGESLRLKMRDADAFVMFSNYENLPCTIIESLCSGVPVIATDVGGIKEHVSQDFGILVAPGDEAGLKKALLEVLNGHRHFDLKKMRTYSEQNFSMERVGDLFQELYSRARNSK